MNATGCLQYFVLFHSGTDEVYRFECLTKKNKRLSFKVVQLNHFFVSNQIKLIEH